MRSLVNKARVLVMGTGVGSLTGEALTVPRGIGSEQDMVYVVPCGKDIPLMGELTELDERSTYITLQNYPLVRKQ